MSPTETARTYAPAQVATRTRRRPLLIAAAIALLALSALSGWLLFKKASTTQSVIAVRTTIPAGTVIKADDLTSVQAIPDPGMLTIPTDQASTVIGRKAAYDLVAGTTVAPAAIVERLAPARGRTVVGGHIKPGMGPTGLAPGTPVRLVVIPDPAQGGQPQASPEPVRGIITATENAADGSGAYVNVDVAQEDAARLQTASAQNRLAVVIDSKER